MERDGMTAYVKPYGFATDVFELSPTTNRQASVRRFALHYCNGNRFIQRV